MHMKTKATHNKGLGNVENSNTSLTDLATEIAQRCAGRSGVCGFQCTRNQTLPQRLTKTHQNVMNQSTHNSVARSEGC